MRINPIKNYSINKKTTPQFKGTELVHSRQKIRRNNVKTVTEHLWSHLRETLNMQYAELYGERKSDYEMDRFVKELVPPVLRNKKTDVAVKHSGRDLSEYGIFPIVGTNNCYRGPIGYSEISELKPLGLNVINVKFLDSGLFIDHINDIVNFIKAMQCGSVYFGCMHGMGRTNRAMSLDYYLNPLQKHTYSGEFYKFDFDDLLDLCDELTPEQKKEMQWTEEFEKQLRAKLKRDQEFWINNT